MGMDEDPRPDAQRHQGLDGTRDTRRTSSAWTGRISDKTPIPQTTSRYSNSSETSYPTTSTSDSTPTTDTPYPQPSRWDAPWRTTGASTTSKNRFPHYDLPGFRQVVDALDVAIATGEQDHDRWRFRDIIQLGNPDILQPDVLNASGPSEVLKIYALATTHNKPLMPHCPSAGIKSMSSLHCYATIKNAIRPPRILDRIRTTTRRSSRTLRRTRPYLKTAS